MNQGIVYTPKKITPRPHEWSPYHTARDSHSSLKHWKDISDISKQLNTLTDLVQVLNRNYLQLKNQAIQSYGFHPFKIYVTPANLRPAQISASFNPVDNWRWVKVRSGLVLDKVVLPTSNSLVYGTDEVTYPDRNNMPSPINHNDILVPSGSSQFWFWIEEAITPTASYHLRYGTDPRVMGAGNPLPTWTNYPTASSTNFPIGYVDSQSSASVNQLVVRQILRTDLMGVGTSHYTTMSICFDGSPQTWFVDAFPVSGSA